MVWSDVRTNSKIRSGEENYNVIKMEFPNLGEHCSESTCNRLDFLPLKCDACQGIFCTDHITYTTHSCPSAYKKNIQVPVCPLCDVPIPIKRGDLPDVAVGLHIDNDCRESRRKHRHPTDHACIGAEEALRLRRLEALNKKSQTKISPNSSNSNSHPFRSLQGTMTEDEALARALQASLDDEERSRRMLQPVPSGNRDRCRLS
ncbi:PREDICTED: AN1-type zinc finger protein 2B isoform X4 [Trachymyrmex septentrionalis]|uniref:AN1-type zinc finger protein 2B isoform X4 n=1 Tax=Trachymyrmex septentrionalis TaxID=34720 RepID=UPI00084F5779|nr:PREDICTED: AN1-type zinc finger protein 2B isoform X4 [Trachymyrmex septentrionalis]